MVRMADEVQNRAEAAPPRDSLLRRFIAHPLTLLVIGFVGFIFLYALSGFAAGRVMPVHNSPVQVLIALVFAGIAVAAYKGYKRWIERAPDHELTLPQAPRELGLGLLTGFVLFSAMAGIVMLLGGLEVLGLRGTGVLWSMLTMAILSGVYEEILFRGVILRHLEPLIGTWAALAATSAFFGAAHLMNPGATWFAAFAIAVEAGIMLGGAYLLTRRLWMAIGIHAAWNFTQGWVFSVPVSGGDAPLGLLITRRVGPDWLTGGDFGLEASVVALVSATLLGVGFMVLVIRRGEIRKPRWMK
jgi:hypothetical protein